MTPRAKESVRERLARWAEKHLGLGYIWKGELRGFAEGLVAGVRRKEESAGVAAELAVKPEARGETRMWALEMEVLELLAWGMEDPGSLLSSYQQVYVEWLMLPALSWCWGHSGK